VDAMELCPVPAGEFLMGSEEDDEEAWEDETPRQTVEIPHHYWLGRYPVTQAQFRELMEDRGYRERWLWTEAEDLGLWTDEGFAGRHGSERRSEPVSYREPFELPNHPVVGVSWYEAAAFCRWLTERWRSRGWLPAGQEVRLPREAEWADGYAESWHAEWTLTSERAVRQGLGRRPTRPGLPNLGQPGRLGRPLSVSEASGGVWVCTPTETDPEVPPIPLLRSRGPKDLGQGNALATRSNRAPALDRDVRCASGQSRRGGGRGSAHRPGRHRGRPWGSVCRLNAVSGQPTTPSPTSATKPPAPAFPRTAPQTAVRATSAAGRTPPSSAVSPAGEKRTSAKRCLASVSQPNLPEVNSP